MFLKIENYLIKNTFNKVWKASAILLALSSIILVSSSPGDSLNPADGLSNLRKNIASMGILGDNERLDEKTIGQALEIITESGFFVDSTLFSNFGLFNLNGTANLLDHIKEVTLTPCIAKLRYALDLLMRHVKGNSEDTLILSDLENIGGLTKLLQYSLNIGEFRNSTSSIEINNILEDLVKKIQDIYSELKNAIEKKESILIPGITTKLNEVVRQLVSTLEMTKSSIPQLKTNFSLNLNGDGFENIGRLSHLFNQQNLFSPLYNNHFLQDIKNYSNGLSLPETRKLGANLGLLPNFINPFNQNSELYNSKSNFEISPLNSVNFISFIADALSTSDTNVNTFASKPSLLSALNPLTLLTNPQINPLGSLFLSTMSSFGIQDSGFMGVLPLAQFQEVFSQFNNIMQKIIQGNFTDLDLQQAINSSNQFEMNLNGIQTVFPLALETNEYKAISNSLVSVTTIISQLNGLSKDPLEFFLPDLQNEFSNVMEFCNVNNLLVLPYTQLSKAAEQFANSLANLHNEITDIPAPFDMPNITAYPVRLAIANGLVFLSAIKVFFSTVVFMLKAPFGIKIFIWEKLLSSIDMPTSLNLFKDIFVNVFGSSMDPLPQFEDTAIATRQLVSQLGATLSGSEVSDSEKIPSNTNFSLSSLLSGGSIYFLRLPVFGFMTQSFDPNFWLDMLKNESASKNKIVLKDNLNLPKLMNNLKSIIPLTKSIPHSPLFGFSNSFFGNSF